MLAKLASRNTIGYLKYK